MTEPNLTSSALDTTFRVYDGAPEQAVIPRTEIDSFKGTYRAQLESFSYTDEAGSTTTGYTGFNHPAVINWAPNMKEAYPGYME